MIRLEYRVSNQIVMICSVKKYNQNKVDLTYYKRHVIRKCFIYFYFLHTIQYLQVIKSCMLLIPATSLHCYFITGFTKHVAFGPKWKTCVLITILLLYWAKFGRAISLWFYMKLSILYPELSDFIWKNLILYEKINFCLVNLVI